MDPNLPEAVLWVLDAPSTIENLELSSMTEALSALQKLENSKISGRPVRATLKKKNNFEKKTKPKKKKVVKKEWAHVQVKNIC